MEPLVSCPFLKYCKVAPSKVSWRGDCLLCPGYEAEDCPACLKRYKGFGCFLYTYPKEKKCRISKKFLEYLKEQ